MHHEVQVGELGDPGVHQLHGVRGEAAVDEAAAVQVQQRIRDLQEEVQQGLKAQHRELGPLRSITMQESKRNQ